MNWQWNFLNVLGQVEKNMQDYNRRKGYKKHNFWDFGNFKGVISQLHGDGSANSLPEALLILLR